MSPESFTEELNSILRDALVAVALYGSAAAGERSERYSDYNLLVVCEKLGIEELNSIRPLSLKWSNFGNPPPLLFTWERLMNSSDVFPIELLDIKENHLMLYGEDVLKRLPISQANLRYQLEHELKGKLIQLRESYLLTDGTVDETVELMMTSLSTFQVLLRASLRFFEVTVPHRKREAVRRLGRHVMFDLSVFDEIQALKDGKIDPATVDTGEMFQKYIETVENAADMVHEMGRRHR